MAASLELHLLGKLRVVVNGRPVVDSLPLKAQALLAYLAVTRETHARPALAGLLWGDVPDDKALNSLRVALTRLRQVCPEHLAVTHLTVAFAPEAGAWLDVAEFERRLSAPSDAEPEQWPAALDLYRGDFLEGLYVEGAPGFDEWVLAQRAHWQLLALRALDEAAARLLAGRDYAGAAHVLRRRLALEPWHEPAHRSLMQALSQAGDFTAALAQYEQCRQVLAAELGAEPMPATTALYERLQAARSLPPPALPPEATPFVGRAAELDRIQALLADPACRLLTLVGLGGVGKTRLALAAARQANQEHALLFLNGVAYVPLAGAAAPEAVAPAVAGALNVPPVGAADASTSVRRYLRNKEMLLVLDNFEQLLAPNEAASAASAWLVGLLDACPLVKLLVTSREPLGLAAEWRLDLDGLPYPEPGAEAEEPARWAALPVYAAPLVFVQAAQRVRPAQPLTELDAPAVVRLCQLVAGNPLALELAAHWLRVMSPAGIVDQLSASLDVLAADLRDLPARQRSLRAIFDETWSRCAPDEQRSLQALAVFQGSFSAEAALAVAGAGLPLLDRLAGRGLVQADPAQGRFSLHTLIGQYAAEQAAPAGAGRAALAGHAAYFAQWLSAQAPGLHTGQQAAAFAALRQESDNLRQAWQWAVAHQRPDLAALMLDGLFDFLAGQNEWQAGESLAAQAVAALFPAPAPPEAGSAVHVRLLVRWADCLRGLSRYAEAAGCLSQARGLAQRLEDPHLLALAWHAQAELEYSQGHYEPAQAAAEKALAEFEALNDQRRVGQAATLLGRLAGILGHYPRAAGYLQRSRAIFQSAGDRLSLSRVLRSLGVDALDVGRYDEAEAYTREALDHLQQLGLERTGHILLNNLGSIAFARGDHDQARAHYAACLSLSQALGDRNGQALAWAGLALAARVAGDLVDALRCGQRSLALAQDIGDDNRTAWALKVLGETERDLRHLDPARQKLEASLAIYQSIGHQDSAAHVLSLLAGVAQQQNDLPAARGYARQSLGLAHSMRSEAGAAAALVNIAHEYMQAQAWPRAAVLLYAVRDHPASLQGSRANAARALEQVAAHLAPGALAAAQAQAQAAGLWGAAAEVLAA